ncbi:hypothetical protein QMZ92_25985 [Streptomyces sp. HNM0645]|uniref:hypothetical protein n=1 Tax=Streptomyces sp. HNM0645 TaxID=2782343 RepID=UPI0024B64F6C|nr:hypothetical protein [Streptomyces sp. HNM0645]MDI9887725.1 hypothetical protein [Streptomyces sp. HNM0645]
MPRKRAPDKSFAEVMASLEPMEGSDPDTGQLSPASAGELVDQQGCLWRKNRGPLDTRVIRRLVSGADELIVGEGAGEVLRPVPTDGREEVWTLIKDELNTSESGRYQAFDFRSEDGRVLLYIEEFC